MISDSFKTAAKDFMGGLKSGATDQLNMHLADAKKNIEGRSPTAGWLMNTVSEEYKKIKDENNSYAKKYNTFVEQDAPGVESLKAEIQKNSSKELSPKKLEKETRNTLRQLEESFKKDPKAAAESELYKKHQTAFDSYKKFADKENESAAKARSALITETTDTKTGEVLWSKDKEKLDSRNKEKSTSKDKVSAKPSADGKVLEEIRDNTEETVEILKEGPNENKPNGTIKSALSSAGGNLVSKVFNEKTIERYAEKIKETLGMPPGKDLKDLKEDSKKEEKDKQIEAKRSDNKEVVDELKKINKFLENKEDEEDTEENKDDLVEARKSEADQIKENLKDKITSKNQNIEQKNSVSDKLKEKSLEENNPLNNVKEKIKNRIFDGPGNKTLEAGRSKGYIPKTEGPKKISGGRFTEPARKVGQVIGKVGRAASSVVSRVAESAGVSLSGRALGVGALVAGTGAAAYGVGSLLATGIDSGISSLTGKETSLGGWIYDKTHNDEKLSEVTPSPTGQNATLGVGAPTPNVAAAPNVTAAPNTPVKFTSNVTAAHTSPVSAVESQLNSSDTITAEKEEKKSQPIIVNSGSTINNSGGHAPPPAVVASPVRNTESTYERVQMQDFWPRAK